MKTKTIAATAAFLVIAGPATAGDLSVSTTVGFESRYVFRGVQFAETSIQPAINLSYGNFYGGAWFNLPIGDDDLRVTPGGEELDLFVGYSVAMDDTFTLDMGVTYYTFPDVASGFFDIFEEDGDGLGANTIEAYLGVNVSGPLSPSVYVYRDFNFDTFTMQGSVSQSFPLAEKTSFNLGGTIGYVVDDDAGGDYLYGNASANIAYQLTDNGSISAGARFGGSDIAGGSIFDDANARTLKSAGVWWGLSFTANF
ncbi:MAG: TorF family putative porin [Pseudomonadota bacterium]